MSNGHPPVVGISLKMYFGLEQTRAWLQEVANLARATHLTDQIETFVVPAFPALAAAREQLAGTGIAFGAQDVFWEDTGPYTGEVSAPMLREAGCSYVVVGHAERRQLFGEDDVVTARKAAAVARAGMTPVICIGEEQEGPSADATEACVAEVGPLLKTLPPDAPLIFAYEPIWAIGADQPADRERIIAVARGLRIAFRGLSRKPRVLYGGSAGPGLYQQIAGDVDGLFLGRFVHNVDNLRAVLEEVAGSKLARAAQGGMD